MKRSTNKTSTTLTAQYELKFLNPKKRPEEALGSLSSFTTRIFLRDRGQMLFLMLSELINFH